ncbi:MAG TPA: thioredoxin domain-containing protein [Actinomycetota bacterium]|nr:thioredoxin domain-containing protein [Actinomycetota bacterium]
MTEERANRLAGSTSPYLRQHAHNPVAWYPWGDEAFALARTSDRPIFLSVGYAACHWCHVMERESFEDEATAAFLNERFISIKVDREERPDVDGIYMDAVQAMNRGQGGWPMTVFCTPEGAPFFAGTYFPDEPRHGMPSFRQVLEGIDEAWRERRDEVDAAGRAVTATLREVTAIDPSAEPLDDAVTDAALAALVRAADRIHGGFGHAPKFPQPMTLEFVARRAVRGDDDARTIFELTLDRMASGGMYDQVTGGFARYSVDERWHVPHFEKMLYDNAQLASVYTHGWLLTRSPEHERIARETLAYLERELRHPGGAFHSSQDADSEGVEGRFATWSWDDLVATVGTDLAVALGAAPEGNWLGEDGPTNVLRRPAPGWTAELTPARERLAEIRRSRVPPDVDDKILSAWNGLAIRAFAEASAAFGDPDAVATATACAAFVWEHLRDADGRLRRSWRDGSLSQTGFADDHADVAAGLLALYEVTGDTVWFDRARDLCDALLADFHDEERGGFFQTAAGADDLVVRPKELYDNAVPSGNAAAADVLLRMGRYTGEAAYERAAVGALLLVRDAMMRAPTGFGHALAAVDLYVGPTREIAIVGAPADEGVRSLFDAVRRDRFVPNAVVAIGSGDGDGPVPLLSDRPAVGGRATAYVCERFLCQMPVTDADALAAQLG